jgi:hypothetical protein
MPNVVDRLGGASSSLAFKAPCRLATAANIDLEDFQTLDGVLPTSSEHVDLRRILVRSQTDAAENGIYIMQDGPWERTKDFDGANDFRRGTRVFVWGGSTASGSYLVTSSMDPSTFDFDDDDITFGLASGVDVTNFEFADGEGIYDDSSNEQLIFQKSSTGAANYFEITNSTAGSAPQLSAAGSDSAINLKFTAKSTGAVTSTSVVQLDAALTSTSITALGGVIVGFSGTPTAKRVDVGDSNFCLDGRSTSNVFIGFDSDDGIQYARGSNRFQFVVGSSEVAGISADGAITSSGITASGGVSVSSTFTSSGNIHAVTGTTITSGGVAGRGIFLYGSTDFGIYAGVGAPTIAAGRGSLYMRTDGASSLTRAYIQTSGSTNTWVGMLSTA